MKKWGREIGWLCLPVLVLGALALARPNFLNWNTLRGEPQDLREGAPRLEMESFERVQPTPLEVVQGYPVILRSKIWRKGVFPFQLKDGEIGAGGFSTYWLEYRREDENWQRAKSRQGALRSVKQSIVEARFSGFYGYFKPTWKVRLEGVPRDAKEIRLVGTQENLIPVRSADCPKLQGKPNWRVSALAARCDLNLKLPFQISIKKPDEPFPTPDVSREKQIEPLGLRWFRGGNFHHFRLHLRHLMLSDWQEKPDYALVNMSVKDAQGRRVTVWRKENGKRYEIKPETFGSWHYAKDSFSSLPRNEIEIPPLPLSVDELGDGVANLKLPLTISGEVSDGTCWPVPFSFQVLPEKLTRSEIGAP